MHCGCITNDCGWSSAMKVLAGPKLSSQKKWGVRTSADADERCRVYKECKTNKKEYITDIADDLRKMSEICDFWALIGRNSFLTLV